MVSFLRLLTLLLLSCSVAKAQSDFRPGYILPVSGDTLRGQVQYRSHVLSAQECIFRLSETAPTQAFAPTALRSYGLTGLRQYQSWSVVSADTTYPSGSRYFLERLVSGQASLYYQRDATAKDRYYLLMRGDTVAVELVRSTSVEARANGVGLYHRYLLEKSFYKTTISKRFADCPAVQITIGRTLFNRTSLMEIVRLYNKCRETSAEPAAMASTQLPDRLLLGALVGAEASQLTFTKNNVLYRGNYQSGPDPVVGLYLMLPLRGVNERLDLRLEVLLESQRYTSGFTNVIGGTTLTYETRMDFRTLRLPLLLRYRLATRGLRPYVEAGFSTSRGLRRNLEIRRTGFSNPALGPWEPADPALKKYQVGLVLGGGVRVAAPLGRPLELAVRGEIDNGFTRTNPSNTTRYYLLLGYSLMRQPSR